MDSCRVALPPLVDELTCVLATLAAVPKDFNWMPFAGPVSSPRNQTFPSAVDTSATALDCETLNWPLTTRVVSSTLPLTWMRTIVRSTLLMAVPSVGEL